MQHRWIKKDGQFVCRRCEKAEPNTPAGRASALKASFCSGRTPAMQLALDEAVDRIDDEIDQARARVQAGEDNDTVYAGLSEAAKDELARRQRHRRKAPYTTALLASLMAAGAPIGRI